MTEEQKIPESEQIAMTVKERLANRIKNCTIEGQDCHGLGKEFDEASKELGITFDQLIDEVFALVSGNQESDIQS